VRLFFVLFITSIGFSQEINLINENNGGLNDPISSKKLQEDLTQIRDIVLSTHPNPFSYISKTSWDSLYLKMMHDFREDHTLFDFFYKTSIWINQLKDSHAGLDLGDIYYNYKKNDPWFDFNLERINAKFYANYFFQNAIPYGSEILKINQISVDSIFRISLAFAIQEGDSFEAKNNKNRNADNRFSRR